MPGQLHSRKFVHDIIGIKNGLEFLVRHLNSRDVFRADELVSLALAVDRYENIVLNYMGPHELQSEISSLKSELHEVSAMLKDSRDLAGSIGGLRDKIIATAAFAQRISDQIDTKQ
jgi:hypothetical protein